MDAATIQKILGINQGSVYLSPSEMAENMTITFFPSRTDIVNREVIEFSDKLKNTLPKIGIKVLPYDQSLKTPSFGEVIKRFVLFFRLYSLVINSLKSVADVKQFEKSYLKLSDFEKIKKFKLLPSEFSQENEELTPTLKLRRHIIYRRYKKEIKSMYN